MLLNKSMKALVILPTYNEAKTLPKVLSKVSVYKWLDTLLIDDNSSDGTAEIAENWHNNSDKFHIIKRPSKLGLGSAYITGFKWGLERGYDYFYEMDADLSHNPDALPWFIKEMDNGGYDLMIGSRYTNGTISVVGWDFRRLLLSKFGNLYASRILGLKLTDLTSGFRCYKRQALQAIDLDKIYSNGYAFQIEMAYLIKRAGFRVGEMPITFYERASGSSKMSKKIVREAIILPWRLRIKEIIDFFSKIFFKKKYVKEISH
jgi:dolichol-phosphate mannosyltransferase